MVNKELLKKYFPEFSNEIISKLLQLDSLYTEWNQFINVISRKDMEFFFCHHVLHSLSILKILNFDSRKKVLDVGTGGGFPGIPLAIACPDIHFTLVDSIGKKIKVVQGVAESLQLGNVIATNARSEQLVEKYDDITCRAVTRLAAFYGMVKHLTIKNKTRIIALKGGDLVAEIAEFRMLYPNLKVEEYLLSSFFSEEFFETKKLIVVYC